MTNQHPKRHQSICRWTFHPGAGGFVPSDMRNGFEDLTPTQFGEIVNTLIKPRVPDNTRLGVAAHYDLEVNEEQAEPFAKDLKQSGLAIAMFTPGAHFHWANGGIASLNATERRDANAFAIRAADILLGPLKIAEDSGCPPAYDIWDGSFGYRYATPLVRKMVRYADAGIAGALMYIRAHKNGKRTKVGVEPKGFEKHPAHIYQTSDSVLALRERLRAAGIDVDGFGLINEFGHSEMQGLELVQEYSDAALAKNIDNYMATLLKRLSQAGNNDFQPTKRDRYMAEMMKSLDGINVSDIQPNLKKLRSDTIGAIVHVHANSQGGKDGRIGGSGKHDIDYGVMPTNTTLSLAHMLYSGEGDLQKYGGWAEHDMQAGPSDSEQESVNRVVASVCRWEALCRTIESGQYDIAKVEQLLSDGRETKLEFYLQNVVEYANNLANELYHAKPEIALSKVGFLKKRLDL